MAKIRCSKFKKMVEKIERLSKEEEKQFDNHLEHCKTCSEWFSKYEEVDDAEFKCFLLERAGIVPSSDALLKKTIVSLKKGGLWGNH